jgi:hypothetical protein
MEAVANTRAMVTDSKGTPSLFLGCDSYRLTHMCFGLVVKVEGFNNLTGWETVGIYYRPVSASIGLADPEQIELAENRKMEARASR